MRGRSLLFFAMLWVGCVAEGFGAAAVVEPVPLTPTVGLSSDYRVDVDGTPVPVGVETSAGRTFHIASFCMSGEVTVRVRPLGNPSSFTVHPLRLGLPVKREADVVSFRLSDPRKLMIRADGLDPLVLIATPMEQDRPDPADPKVHYYGPGTHRVGRLRVSSGETVYLAPGARFIGTIEGEEVENVRILGRGILDGGEHTDWNRRIYGLVFARSRNITVEGIGIRNCYWWTTEFLLCDNVHISHLNIFTFNRNNGGIMTDGCTDFECRDGIFLTRDDCICPHALNAAGNGEPASTYRFEDCVLYNVIDGNAIRIGASFETREVLNWTFDRIDVLERAGAAIYSDHSDWATVRNLRFIDFHDEVGGKHAIDMKIVKTAYSCQTGYRDERGRFDGLYFVGFHAPGGAIRLTGADADYGFHDVRFYNCEIGGEPVDDPGDIETNDFVTGLCFINDGSTPEPQVVTAAEPPGATCPDELVLDNRSEGFRAVGLEYHQGDPTAHNGDYHLAPVPEGFSSFNAAIYEPRIEGVYEVEIRWGNHQGVATNAPWTVRHADGYTTLYMDQNESPGWHRHGRYRFDASSWVRLALPGYFQATDNPAVADAVRFIRVETQPEDSSVVLPDP